MNRLAIALTIAALALLSQFVFPGHTYLQQDSQIYIPILEHLWDPSALKNEILVIRPHVSFTLFDEAAIALRKLTGAGFEPALQAGQIATRALGLWGIWLMAGAAGLGAWPAILVAGIVGLGASIGGPSVLIWEYEPNPRGFALPLLYLAIGLVAHGRYFWSGVAGSAAFLVHPPSVYPFWGVYFLIALWPTSPELMRRRILGLVPLLAAALLLFLAARHQAGVGETQNFFTRLDGAQEKLQRMRASYVWVSAWWGAWWPQYAVLFAGIALAWWRLRAAARPELRVFLIALPAVGLLSVPASWLLLEQMKWALLPLFQPTRALLFVVFCAMFAAASAGCAAARQRRWLEAFAWFVFACLPPVNTRVTVWPPFHRGLLLALLGAGFCAAAAGEKKRWAHAAAAGCAMISMLLPPTLGNVVNYPRLHTPELEQVSRWARESTPKDAIFLFADAGRDLAPGIFRSEALRAVYVDWKGGGQVNYLKELGEQWWTRWQAAMGHPFSGDFARYRSLGIDYLVLSPQSRQAAAPVYENRRWLVYPTR